MWRQSLSAFLEQQSFVQVSSPHVEYSSELFKQHRLLLSMLYDPLQAPSFAERVRHDIERSTWDNAIRISVTSRLLPFTIVSVMKACKQGGRWDASAKVLAHCFDQLPYALRTDHLMHQARMEYRCLSPASRRSDHNLAGRVLRYIHAMSHVQSQQAAALSGSAGSNSSLHPSLSPSEAALLMRVCCENAHFDAWVSAVRLLALSKGRDGNVTVQRGVSPQLVNFILMRMKQGSWQACIRAFTNVCEAKKEEITSRKWSNTFMFEIALQSLAFCRSPQVRNDVAQRVLMAHRVYQQTPMTSTMVASALHSLEPTAAATLLQASLKEPSFKLLPQHYGALITSTQLYDKSTNWGEALAVAATCYAVGFDKGKDMEAFQLRFLKAMARSPFTPPDLVITVAEASGFLSDRRTPFADPAYHMRRRREVNALIRPHYLLS